MSIRRSSLIWSRAQPRPSSIFCLTLTVSSYFSDGDILVVCARYRSNRCLRFLLHEPSAFLGEPITHRQSGRWISTTKYSSSSRVEITMSPTLVGQSATSRSNNMARTASSAFSNLSASASSSARVGMTKPLLTCRKCPKLFQVRNALLRRQTRPRKPGVLRDQLLQFLQRRPSHCRIHRPRTWLDTLLYPGSHGWMRAIEPAGQIGNCEVAVLLTFLKARLEAHDLKNASRSLARSTGGAAGCSMPKVGAASGRKGAIVVWPFSGG